MLLLLLPLLIRRLSSWQRHTKEEMWMTVKTELKLSNIVDSIYLLLSALSNENKEAVRETQ